MFKKMSAGTRSLIALTALVGVSATTVALLDLEPEPPLEVAEVEEVATASLASLPIAREDFQTILPLDARRATLKRRETLSDLIKRLDLPNNDGHRALYSLTSSDLLDARRVRPGLEVTAHVDGDQLNAFTVDLEAGRRLLTKRMPNGEYQAMALNSAAVKWPMVVKGTIQTSLYQDAQVLGAEDQQVVDFAAVQESQSRWNSRHRLSHGIWR